MSDKGLWGSRSMSTLVLYCERALSPDAVSLWAEPLNVASNAAYVLVGCLALRRSTERDHWSRILGLLALLVGLGSAGFHAIASPWTMLGDVVPIAVFMVAALVAILGQVTGNNVRLMVVGVAAFVVATAGLLAMPCQPTPPTIEGVRELPWACLSGGIGYTSAIAALAVVTWHFRAQSEVGWNPWALGFGFVATTLAVSLVVRALDVHACPLISSGELHLTAHTLWHLGTAFGMHLTIKLIATGPSGKILA